MKSRQEKLPILVVIKPDGEGRYNNFSVDSNFIKTMFGKDSPQAFLQKLNENSEKLLFMDEKRTREMLKVAGLQLPAKLSNLRFNYIIHKSNNVVNEKVQNSIENLSPEQMEEVRRTEELQARADGHVSTMG